MHGETERRGIVIHSDQHEVHLLTPRGKVFRVASVSFSCPPSLGEEVPVPAVTGVSPSGRRARPPFLAALAPLAAAAVLALVLLPRAFDPVIATVVVEINPQVELGIDAEAVVRRAEGINDDGSALLVGLQLKGLPLDRAVEEITIGADRAGKLAEDAIVFTAVVPLKGNADPAVLEGLAREGAAKAVRRSERDATVIATVAERKILRQARKAGLPVARIILEEKARQQGLPVPPITPGQKRKLQTLREEIKAMGIDPAEIFPDAVTVPPRPAVPGRTRTRGDGGRTQGDGTRKGGDGAPVPARGADGKPGKPVQAPDLRRDLPVPRNGAATDGLRPVGPRENKDKTQFRSQPQDRPQDRMQYRVKDLIQGRLQNELQDGSPDRLQRSPQPDG